MLHTIYSTRRLKYNPEEITEKIPFALPDYKALHFATILEDMLMELYSLDKLNTHLRISSLMMDLNYLRTKRYNLARPLEADSLNTIDPMKLECSDYKLNKLVTDSKLIIKVIQDTFMSLKSSRTFAPLGFHVLGNIEHVKYCKQLEEDEKNNSAIKHDLYKRLRLQRRHDKKERLAQDTIIYNLSVELEDLELIGAVRSRYVDGWQRARTSQHLQVIADVEVVPADKIYNYKSRTDGEQVVHSQIEYYLNMTIDDTLNTIVEWMDKYDAHMEDIDVKIQIKKHEYQNSKMERIALEEKLASREKEMTDWITFKTERENLRLHKEKMHNSAIKVQAWWRGLIVRKNLGPYKVRRKKKK